MIGPTQMPKEFRDIIDKQVEEYDAGLSTGSVSEIPDTKDIPLTQRHWLKIPDVVCVFVDMRGSTQLSAVQHEQSTAGAYQLFTETAVRLFDAFDAPYIDVRGDGVFALFNSDQVYRALAAAVTFKTFAADVFAPKIRNKTNGKVQVGSHIGIDQKTVLVRKIGMRVSNNRTDRQNEVWAGKPVNMASKLASIGAGGDLLVSDRYYNRITDTHARLSCGCGSNQQNSLWRTMEVPSDKNFDFQTIYSLISPGWCRNHGEDYCNTILGLDG